MTNAATNSNAIRGRTMAATMRHSNEFRALVSKLDEWETQSGDAKRARLEAHYRHQNRTPGWSAFFLGWDHAIGITHKNKQFASGSGLMPTPGSISKGYYRAGKIAGRDWKKQNAR